MSETDTINVKDAIKAAKAYVLDVYADETLTNLGLEETTYDESRNCWSITIGFSRPWNSPRGVAAQFAAQTGSVVPQKRTYKVVEVAEDGRVKSMVNRETVASE